MIKYLPDHMEGRQWLDTVTSLLNRHGFTVPNFAPDWSKWDSEYRELR
jgi:hypothetical protein